MLKKLHADVSKLSDPEKAKLLAGFFKTGKGQYGEGDVFCGISVSVSRKIALKYQDLSLEDVSQLLTSKLHEERLIALLILIAKYSHAAKASRDNPKGDARLQKEIFDFYLTHMKYINNWDLVDLSADKIVGEFLWNYCHPGLDPGSIKKDSRFRGNDRKEILTRLARSTNLWERRIAMVSTFAYIKKGIYEMTFLIADILLQDTHDLIQKAVGWMLREVGKRISVQVLEEYLKTRYKIMPRTALRYAIERFPEDKRKKYLRGEV